MLKSNSQTAGLVWGWTEGKAKLLAFLQRTGREGHCHTKGWVVPRQNSQTVGHAESRLSHVSHVFYSSIFCLKRLKTSTRHRHRLHSFCLHNQPTLFFFPSISSPVDGPKYFYHKTFRWKIQSERRDIQGVNIPYHEPSGWIFTKIKGS